MHPSSLICLQIKANVRHLCRLCFDGHDIVLIFSRLSDRTSSSSSCRTFMMAYSRFYFAGLAWVSIRLCMDRVFAVEEIQSHLNAGNKWPDWVSWLKTKSRVNEFESLENNNTIDVLFLSLAWSAVKFFMLHKWQNYWKWLRSES